ncbi:17280_t:CDS:1, partial [Racocetra fulgida]
MNNKENYISKTVRDNNKPDEIPYDKFLVGRHLKRWDYGIFKDAKWKDTKERVALLYPKENNQFSK